MRRVSKGAGKRFGNDLGRDTNKDLGFFLCLHSDRGFLFVGTLCSDFLTEGTWMLAIEGLFNGLGQRAASGIIPDHVGPSYAL